MNKSPIQKILFGSPGTGKSYKIDYEIIPKELNIQKSETPENIIKTVFHPEYTYGDFMGKLVPLTRGDKVEYRYYEGHFLKALSRAYKNFLEAHNKHGEKLSDIKNVVLVIDEINRGNSSAIFGTVFQLLDRDKDGWSSYELNITEIEFLTLLELIGVKLSYDNKGNLEGYHLPPYTSEAVKNLESLQKKINFLQFNLVERIIKIPPNLSILATMNTSDNSIFFMDSAFKRRWDWEFIDWNDDCQMPKPKYGSANDDEYGYLTELEWKELVKGINQFIKDHHQSIRGIEDKQIGYFFIKERPIPSELIRNKLMFFLWDSVFNRDKKPLIRLLDIDSEDLITFGDFTRQHNNFIKQIQLKYELNIKQDSRIRHSILTSK